MPKVLASPHPRGRLSLRGGLVAALLAPFLAIGLIIGTPTTVAAAERFSGSQTIPDVEVYDSVLPSDGLHCSFVTQYRVGDANPGTYVQYINGKASCSDGAAIISEGVKVVFDYSGQTGNGDACYADGFGNLDAGLKASASGFAGVNLDQAQLCEVVEICVSVTGELERIGLPNSDVDFRDCWPSTMGEPKVPGGGSVVPSCVELDAIQTPTMTVINPSAQYGGGLNDYRPRFEADPTTSYQPVNKWRFYAWIRNSQGAESFFLIDSTSMFDPLTGVYTKLMSGVEFTHSTNTILGMGFFDSTKFDGNPTNAMKNSLPQSNGVGRVGVTDPSKCAFYWGTKIASIPDDDRDEPVSDLGVTPDPTEDEAPDPAAPPASENEGCSFSLTDPSTWLEGGSCAVVGAIMELVSVLRSVLTAILDLAAKVFGPIVDALEWLWDQIGAALQAINDAIAAIWDGFTGLMSDLFVPEQGFLDAKLGQVRADLDNTSPGKWVAAVGDFVPGGVSGCDGLPVNIDLGPVEIDERLGAACTGFMADAAQIVRVCLSAVLVLFGAMSCLRAVGSGFGWSPGVSPGSGAAT